MSVLLAVGSQAPDVSLPATTGDTVSLSHYRGKRNLILVFYVGITLQRRLPISYFISIGYSVFMSSILTVFIAITPYVSKP